MKNILTIKNELQKWLKNADKIVVVGIASITDRN